MEFTKVLKLELWIFKICIMHFWAMQKICLSIFATKCCNSLDWKYQTRTTIIAKQGIHSVCLKRDVSFHCCPGNLNGKTHYSFHTYFDGTFLSSETNDLRVSHENFTDLLYFPHISLFCIPDTLFLFKKQKINIMTLFQLSSC